MKLAQYTYWNMVINNPDENDQVLIENPSDKYIRQLVWTPELGAEGTPHIQAWIRMQRNVGLTVMKKMYPRGHFRFIDRDEFLQNSIHYAQKNDETTQGKHIITLNDPLPSADTILYKVVERGFDNVFPILKQQANDPKTFRIEHAIRDLPTKIFLFELGRVENDMVCEKSGLEKIFISPTYERMKQKFWKQILVRKYINPNGESSSGCASEESEEGKEDGTHVTSDTE